MSKIFKNNRWLKTKTLISIKTSQIVRQHQQMIKAQIIIYLNPYKGLRLKHNANSNQIKTV